MDHLELYLSSRLALRLDDRPSPRPREERLALARAVHPGSTSYAHDLRPLPSAAVVVVANDTIIPLVLRASVSLLFVLSGSQEFLSVFVHPLPLRVLFFGQQSNS